MKKKYGLKTILASLLVTASLVTPAVVMSEGALPDMDAELIFEGARLEYKTVDGKTTVQAVFDVSVDKVVNGTGASFYLDYNPDYLTPSDMTTNVPVTTGETDAFFSADPNLFRDENGNSISPFDTILRSGNNIGSYYSTVDTATDRHLIHMTLHLAQDATGAIAQNGGGEANATDSVETMLGVFSDDMTRKSYVINPWTPLTYEECNQPYSEYDWPDKVAKKVTLGQLSFQVNMDRLPEIVKYFGSMDVLSDHRTNDPQRPRVKIKLLDNSDGPETYLLDVSQTIKQTDDPWQVSAYGGTDISNHPHPHYHRMSEVFYSPDRTDTQRKNVADHYIFNLPKDAIIKVEATNPELTINAYQNFTDGTADDLPISLGKYSPMVTVTYADGSKENIPFPWGKTADGYTVTDGLANPYDPTHGDYTFSQLYRYTDSDGNPQTFPTPVTAIMHVTPITVIKVTADDLERTYPLNRVTADVKKVDDLNLPTEARIITDIVPAGVSLTTPIKGWTPANKSVTGSAWPTVPTNLHTLKGDTALATDADPKPYWPEVTDLSPVAANHVGTYSFQTSQANHVTEEGILSADIRAAYPWLTVPDQSGKTPSGRDEWLVDNAKRHIVADGDYADSEKYAVSYVSTVTQTASGNGNGQPTLTLAVRRTDQNINENSVFRIWLPNGQEIGTGQDKGGVQVDDWFGGKTFADHTYGFYDPGSRELANTGDYYHFKLDINPDDPTQNPYGNERETLRRYINLGGWYKVAICEDPDKADPNVPDNWTDPIPVYVPPRRNEYVEDKTYNFIAENAALFNWPGGVKDTIYLPRGSYNPVGPMVGPKYTASGVGLPLYEKQDGTVTDGLTDSATVFENSNPMRPLLDRYEESYGLKTIYDGQTGAQPGEIFTVKVDQTVTDKTKDWTKPTTTETLERVVDDDPPTPVKKYGDTPLYTGTEKGVNDEGLQVMAFGYVHQPLADLYRYKAILRTQLKEKDTQIEKIKLVSASPTGITRVVQNDYDSNVTLVTYDTKMEGYTVRQDYTLTIKNVGDVDIYGLDIDGLTDGYPTDPKGGRFEMLQPPASFLPAGSSTTFTLTYVYDLRGNNDNTALNYRDTLYITSTAHPTAVRGGSNQENPDVNGNYQYLLDFDAQFAVTKSPLHKVTVIYKPTNGTMGTAGLIVGEQSDGTNTTMNYTTTTQTFPADDPVFVVINKVDEYEVKSVTIDDGNGNPITYKGNQLTIDPYSGTATLVDGTEVRVFTMPDQDVTVTVNFYEPLSSKLRLGDLIEFSAPSNNSDDPNDLKTSAGSPAPKDPEHTYRVWRKTFTDAEEAAADQWSTDHSGANRDFYLMTTGTVMPHAPGYPAGGWPANAVPADEGQQFVRVKPAGAKTLENQYIVVIDSKFDLSQVEATLRKVVYHEDYQGLAKPGDADYDEHQVGYNDDIEVDVQMDVYPYGVQETANWNQPGYRPTVVYDNDIGYGPRPGYTGDLTPPPPYDLSGKPSVHTTAYFSDQGTVFSTPTVNPEALSPKPGESTYVRITLSAKDPESGMTVSRYYYLEIHRRTDEPRVDLRYGNSPYGMIWNEKKFTTDPSRAGAEAAFVAAGYTFRNADASVTPDKVVEHGLNVVTYWREAWVRNRGLFEPESFTAANDIAKPSWVDKAVYDPANNLDLNRYAYFAILGKNMREPGVLRAWDSSGRAVDPDAITAEAEVTLLDVTGTTQVARFSGTAKATIDLGVANGKRILTFLDEHQTATTPTATIDHWPVSADPDTGGETTTYSLIEDIRPGRYLIQYTYTDFDGVSKLNYYRPFVILRGVGDVNTDGTRDNGRLTVGSDEYAIEDRVTDPLGYEAGEWDGTKELVYPYANIFKFRVCDVNNDRNINNIDANLTDKNARAEINNGSDLWLRFYEPVDYGLPDPDTMP